MQLINYLTFIWLIFNNSAAITAIVRINVVELSKLSKY